MTTNNLGNNQITHTPFMSMPYVAKALLTSEEVKKLTKEFSSDKLRVKAQSRNKDKTSVMLVLYLQHTDVMDRLEEVDPCWSTQVLEHFNFTDKDFAGKEMTVTLVRMKMTVREVTRENVGEGNDLKSAYSDALKRCAMLFGVGRYLYDSQTVWMPYNESTDKYKIYTMDDYQRAKDKKYSLPKKQSTLTQEIKSISQENAVQQQFNQANYQVLATQGVPLPQIYPSQPEEGDGIQPTTAGPEISNEDYRINFGKFNKRSLKEVGADALRNYVAYLETNGNPLSQNAIEFIERADKFVADWENKT